MVQRKRDRLPPPLAGHVAPRPGRWWKILHALDPRRLGRRRRQAADDEEPLGYC